MLDNYVRDFKALIDWIQLQEKLEKTDAQNRCFLFLSSVLPHSLIYFPFWIVPSGETEGICDWSLAYSHKQIGSIVLALIQKEYIDYCLTLWPLQS